MPAPRLEIDLAKIHHNASQLVTQFALQGISITGVCKATLGLTEVANTMCDAGVRFLADSHIENIESMRRDGVRAEMTLIRSPMLSQVARVVASADVSLNTEIEVIQRLSAAAQKIDRVHGVVLMVELGDRREGIMPDDLLMVVGETLRLPNIVLKGIGTNLACRNGISPDVKNMAELSALADLIEATFEIKLDLVSGGNSANVDWGLSESPPGRINNLRLGESILLGCETLHRQPIPDLFTDAFTLVAEVIESNIKPSKPEGVCAQTAFGEVGVALDCGLVMQSILAIGRQDIDPEGLVAPTGIEVMAASSDHMIVVSETDCLALGSEVAFQLNYSALLLAMTSPFVAKVIKKGQTVSACSAHNKPYPLYKHLI